MQSILRKPAETGRITNLEIVSEKNIKQIQKRFCEVANVFVFCMDNNGQCITDMSGNPEEIKRIKELVPMDRFMSLYQRVTDSTVEEQAVEDTAYPNLKVAAISIRVQSKPMITWLVCAMLKEEAGKTEEATEHQVLHQIEEERFYSALDLLRRISNSLLEAKALLADAEAESRISKTTQNEMSVSLKRTEATTAIVQLLECDDTIEVIMEEILKVAGSYLDISSAQVFRLNKDGETMDVMAEWCNEGVVSVFDQTRNIKRLQFLKYNKAMAISLDSKMAVGEREALEEAHIKAIISIPIYINGIISMSICFNETMEARSWSLDDIKFTSNASKVLQSILVRRIQKNSLASSYTSLESILDNVGSSIYVKDMESKKILFVNRMLKENFKEEFSNGTLDELFESGKPIGNKGGTFEINHRERNRWYDLHYTYINWVDGRQVALCSIYDITDKKVYQKKIEQQAYTDFLTGLCNRMCCERDLAWHIDNSKKFNLKGALLYLDLDDFKHINDGLGHQYGDVLLKAIAHSLQRIEGIESTCYRMGGDEFVILVPPNSYPRFGLILEEIKGVFAKPWFLKDADYYCTMSMGAVKFPEDGDSVQNLIKKADIAMYEAKKSGKNRMAFYSDSINTASNKRLDMEKNMRDATVDGYKEFEIYYQPIIDIQKEGDPCTGAEALLRWNSVEMGFMQPSDFIPLAEYLGLINPIGNYVLREACFSCKEWNDNGYPNYKVNVNLSVVQLLQTDIVDIVDTILQETGIRPKNLTLEVTESLAINDMERMKGILGKIRNLGVRIALDDFGTGYSSLNHIREIPLDVIKVDQSFVIDLAEDTYSQSFIKMIGELAESIGVSVCVEGIENEAQYKVLEGMKVRLIQGYYIDKPMKKEVFEGKYLKKYLKKVSKQ